MNQMINGLISLCSSRTQRIILVRINVVYIILCRLVNKYHLNTNQLSHMWFRSDMGTLLHSVNQVWRGTILTIIPPTTQTRTIPFQGHPHLKFLCANHIPLCIECKSPHSHMSETAKEAGGAAVRQAPVEQTKVDGLLSPQSRYSNI